MDLGCFYSDEKSPLNIVSSILMTGNTNRAALESIYGKVCGLHPKMTARIETVFGDLYYK